ncbi:MAG: aspartate-semialdehyde dehydrogenase [Nitrososphaeria archaeon]
MGKLKVAILGATGMVGQQYIRLLDTEPWFEISILVGKKSAGKLYGEVTEWVGECDPPSYIKKMKVEEQVPLNSDVDLLFSCLPSDAAKEQEGLYARSYPLVSNASAYRMEKDVPVLVPEVNSNHLGLISAQKEGRGWKGFIVTKPNCTTAGLVMTLKPLDDLYKIKRVIVTTMQAVSGAGFPGVPSLQIIDNIVPYIKDEEEKLIKETKKILGRIKDGSIVDNELMLAASCNRVPVIDGHTESVYIEAEKEIDVEEAKSSMASFKGLPQELKLPMAPEKPIIVMEGSDRPQTRRDRNAGSVPGMSVVVGRVRKGLDRNSLQYTLLSHNTIRGAAGNAILTAELLCKLGYLER